MRSRRNKIIGYMPWIVLGIVLGLLIFPVVWRFLVVGTAPGYETYYHHRLAKEILTHGLVSNDVLMPERSNLFTPFHILLAGFQLFIGDGSMLLFPLLFGLANVVLLYYLLARLGFKVITRGLILCLYASSPIFLWSSWFLTPYSVILFFQLLGTWFFIRKDKAWVSVLLYGFASLFGLVHLLMNTFFVLFWRGKKKVNKKLFYAIIWLNSLLFVFYHLPRIIFNRTISVAEPSFFVGFFTDFGGISGFSIFLVLLGIIGLAYVRKNTTIIFYLGSFVLIIHSVFSVLSRIYTNLLLCVLGGITLHHLLIRKWNLRPIRNLFLLVVIFGLLFSSFVFISQASSRPPSVDIYKGLHWLASVEGETHIFSSYTNGYWIQDISGKRAFLDANSLHYPVLEQKLEDFEITLHSYDLDETRHLLEKYAISHIVLTRQDEAPGFRFLLENNETFKKVYALQDIAIWEFLG